jgi:hypothetical protein
MNKSQSECIETTQLHWWLNALLLMSISLRRLQWQPRRCAVPVAPQPWIQTGNIAPLAESIQHHQTMLLLLLLLLLWCR